MKKLGSLIVLSTLSVSVWAQNNPEKAFSGAQIGVGLGATKYVENGANKPDSLEHTPDVDIMAGYAFDYGKSNLVGEVNGKIRVAPNKKMNTNKDVLIRERVRYGVGYAQGYRFTPDLMPYVKAQYLESHMKSHERQTDAVAGQRTFRGYGVGMGAKYALTPDVELSAEYMRSQLRSKQTTGQDTKTLKGHTFNAGVAYRF